MPRAPVLVVAILPELQAHGRTALDDRGRENNADGNKKRTGTFTLSPDLARSSLKGQESTCLSQAWLFSFLGNNFPLASRITVVGNRRGRADEGSIW